MEYKGLIPDILLLIAGLLLVAKGAIDKDHMVIVGSTVIVANAVVCIHRHLKKK